MQDETRTYVVLVQQTGFASHFVPEPAPVIEVHWKPSWVSPSNMLKSSPTKLASIDTVGELAYQTTASGQSWRQTNTTHRLHTLAALHRPNVALGVASDEGAAVCKRDKGEDGECVAYEHVARRAGL